MPGRPARGAYGRPVLAIEFSTIRDVALGISVGAVVLAVVFAIVIKWIVGKLITVAILVLLAGVVWWQRDSLQDCADRVGQTLSAGATNSTTCTFFGRDVTVDSPLD
jgi:hypothetical protein